MGQCQIQSYLMRGRGGGSPEGARARLVSQRPYDPIPYAEQPERELGNPDPMTLPPPPPYE